MPSRRRRRSGSSASFNRRRRKHLGLARHRGGYPALRDMARSFATDESAFQTAMKALRSATSPEAKQEALAAAKAARAEMALPTKLAKELDEKIAELEPEAMALMEEKARLAKEGEEFDAKALPEAKQKRAQLLSLYRFEEARLAISGPELRTEKAKEEQDLLAKKTQWLANFKSQLVTDLNAKGYAAPVARPFGRAVSGGVAKADDQQIHFRSAADLVVRWADLPPETVIAMARSFIPRICRRSSRPFASGTSEFSPLSPGSLRTLVRSWRQHRR
jgi:hypothetical protein